MLPPIPASGSVQTTTCRSGFQMLVVWFAQLWNLDSDLELPSSLPQKVRDVQIWGRGSGLFLVPIEIVVESNLERYEWFTQTECLFGSQSTEAFDCHDRASSLLLIFPLIAWETLIHAEDAALETESLPSHSFIKRCYRVKWVFPYTCFTDCPRISTQSSNKLYLGPPGTEHWVWRWQRRRMTNPCYLAMGLSSQTHFTALQVFGKHGSQLVSPCHRLIYPWAM